MNSSSKFILQNFTHPQETAIFGVGQRIGGLIGLMLFGFQMSWGPIAAKLMSEPDKAKVFYSRVARYFWIISSSFLLALSLLTNELIIILTNDTYLKAVNVIPFVALGSLMWGFIYIAALGYQYAGKTYHQMIGMSIGTVVMIASSLPLIFILGALGASIGLALGFITCVIYCLYASNKYLKVEYDFFKITTSLLLVITIAIICNNWLLVNFSHFNWITFVCKFGLIAIYSVYILFILLDVKDRSQMVCKIKSFYDKIKS